MPASPRDEIVELTCDLVAIPSVAEQPDQLYAVIDYAERYARALPGVAIHRAESLGKPSLMVTLRDTHTPAVIFNAHLDVVPANEAQFTPDVRDGRIYGRGSQDMKGSGAVLLRLMKDLAALPDPPDVGFMFVSDEETGGDYGTGYLLKQGWRCDFFLAAEPTDLGICFVQKGSIWYEIRMTGQPAHGSRPWDGRNAIHALRDGLVALERRFPTPDEPAWITTMVPTIVRGGDAGNRLPAEVVLTIDTRHIPEDRPDDVTAALQACFPDGEIRMARSCPPLVTDRNNPWVQRLSEAIAGVRGQPVELYREHFASDGRFYSSAGIPAVCCGPVGAGLHSDEEWVDIDSLAQLHQTLLRLATQPG